MKIVKFKNGKYAIRRFNLIWYEYLNIDIFIKDRSREWHIRKEKEYPDKCQKSLCVIQYVYEIMKDRGRKVWKS
jgi:hypothetical protein